MAENLTFRDIESEAGGPLDLVQINTCEEKKESSTPLKNPSVLDKSTPSSHATNILKARSIAIESQEYENAAPQKAPPQPLSAYVLFIKDLKQK